MSCSDGALRLSILLLALLDAPVAAAQDPVPPAPMDTTSAATADAAAVTSAESVAPSPVLALEDALEGALRDNPGLAEMEARAEAMAAIPSQAGTLPDPALSLNALNFPVQDGFDRTKEPMTQLQLGISQQFPFPGKLALREEAAEREAEAAVSRVEETRLRLIRDVQRFWWELYFLDRSLETIRRNQALLREFVEIARTKYEVGRGLQQDVLLAQLELSKLLDLEISLVGARRTEQARLNVLLNRPADTVAVLPAQAEPALAEVPEEQELFRLAEEYRPILAEQRKSIAATETRVDLAHKEYYPDFSIGAAYGLRGGNDADGGDRSDFASIMFSMTFPIYTKSKQDKLLAQRKAEERRARHGLQQLREQVQGEISSTLAELDRARERALLFRTGIIPQARQTVGSMRAGYEVNKVDFLNLVSAQITLYNYELQYWRVLTQAKMERASLATAVGRERL